VGIVFVFSPSLAHNLRIPATSKTRKRSRRTPAADLSARTDSRLGRIVRLLTDHATFVVSGTKLAQEIGASRSAVWRFVQQLRSLGVEIKGHPTTGYQLERVPDLLLPEILAPLVKGSMFGARIHHYFRVGSTNAAAMEAAAAGEPEGAAFFSEEQTAGRGRGGNAWHSEKSSGIYCSVVLRPHLAPADAVTLSLAAGLAVQAAVQLVTGLAPDLRWPNDVLLADKKFCGILAEMNAEATRVRYAVIGIGINVNHADLPGDLRGRATSLRLETGRVLSRVELAAALLKSLDREYRALDSTDPAARDALLRRFEERSSYARGKPVRVEENGGFEGVTEGLDARGFLRVRTPEGMRTVLSGGVRAL
jgi:BirA family biotin operon repressor/biotin-[acetyl-CoA-carboxylase] ligase